MNITTLLNTLSNFEIEEPFQSVEEEFDPKSLIGRSIVAKKWNRDDIEYDPKWTESMNAIIGKIGIIESIGSIGSIEFNYLIKFDNYEQYWFTIDFTRTLLI